MCTGLTDVLTGVADADGPRLLAGLDKLRLIHARYGLTSPQPRN